MSAFAPAPGRLWARWGLDPRAGVIDGLCLEWNQGRLTRAEPSPQPPADWPPECIFSEHLLTPGLLNAHVHLDYSFLKGRLPRHAGFAPWLRALLGARREMLDSTAQQAVARAAARAALEALRADGVTEIWDIRSFGYGTEALAALGTPAIEFDEWIAPRESEWDLQWPEWRNAWRARTGASESYAVVDGISPHSPYTVCPSALAEASAWAREQNIPLAIHLAESLEERRLLMAGEGPLRDLMTGVPGWDPEKDLGAPASAIARAEAAGALDPRTLAIHCNLPEPGEARQLADSGAVVVFCPQSHRFFGYPAYPLADYRQAGVRLALGTDSLASNDALSIRAELRAFIELATDWSPLEQLAVATGAALGEIQPYGGRGLLQTGHPARWALWKPRSIGAAPTPENLMTALLDPQTTCTASSAKG